MVSCANQQNARNVNYLDNEPSNTYGPLLTNAMNTHNCLFLNCRIPPWILHLISRVRWHFVEGRESRKAEGQECVFTIRKTFDAAVRFKPTPPALSDINNTCRKQWNEMNLPLYHKQKHNLALWLTIFSLVSLNSFKTRSLCFWTKLPSNRRYPILFLCSGISNRSRNEVHWLKTMLFSPEPERHICSRQSKSFETFEDSFQFFSTSILNRVSDGHVIRSVFLITCRQIGHAPAAGVRQHDKRHSLHILCAQGVSTGSSADSRHIGHSAFSPFRRPSTTSSTYACEGTFLLPESELVSRNLLASLFMSAYCCVSDRLEILRKHNVRRKKC